MALAERLGVLRLELFGDRGGPEMARRLGIPVRTWYNYEGGVTVPAEVVLKIIELTSVEPSWLLSGKGPKFRHIGTSGHDSSSGPAMTVRALLSTALQILESEETAVSATEIDDPTAGGIAGVAGSGRMVSVNRDDDRDVVNGDPQSLEASSRGSHTRQEWLAAQRENRCIRVTGEAMAPILADGASVAYSPRDEDVTQLHKKMVVVWLDGNPMVRWFEHCGRYALLKAENPDAVPSEVLVDLEDVRKAPRFRRVLWINSPH